MSSNTTIKQEQLKARMLNLLCAIIERELAHPDRRHQGCSQTRCPRCGRDDVTKRGHDSTGKQRYQCKTCERSFTSATGSALSSTNIPSSTWMKFAECHINGSSLRISASYCRVSLKTAFFMRKRINSIVANYLSHVKRIRNRIEQGNLG